MPSSAILLANVDFETQREWLAKAFALAAAAVSPELRAAHPAPTGADDGAAPPILLQFFDRLFVLIGETKWMKSRLQTSTSVGFLAVDISELVGNECSTLAALCESVPLPEAWPKDIPWPMLAREAIARAVTCVPAPPSLRSAHHKRTPIGPDDVAYVDHIEAAEMERHHFRHRLDADAVNKLRESLSPSHVTLVSGVSGDGKTIACWMLSNEKVTNHVSLVSYSFGASKFDAEFQKTEVAACSLRQVDAEDDAADVAATDALAADRKLRECQAVYRVLAAQMYSWRELATTHDSIAFVFDEVVSGSPMLRALCRAVGTSFSLSGDTKNRLKKLGDHLSDQLQGARVYFVAAGTGVGRHFTEAPGSNPKSYAFSFAMENRGLFTNVVKKLADDRAIHLLVAQVLLDDPSCPRALLPSERAVIRRIRRSAQNARFAAIMARILQSWKTDTARRNRLADEALLLPTNATGLLVDLERRASFEFKLLNGLNTLSLSDYVVVVTLAVAASLSRAVSPLDRFRQPTGAQRASPHRLEPAAGDLKWQSLAGKCACMLHDMAESASHVAAGTFEAIPGSEFTSADGFGLVLRVLSDSESALSGRRTEPRFTMEAGQVHMSVAVCDGRSEHTASGDGFEVALLDTCVLLARLMQPVVVDVLRSPVPATAAAPHLSVLRHVGGDEFARELADRLHDKANPVAARGVRVDALPHRFVKKHGAPTLKYSDQSFEDLMRDAARDPARMWDTHYVLKNARTAPGADIIVILQREQRGTYEVVFVQAKFCATHDSAARNAAPTAIRSELTKALVEPLEVAAGTVPTWRTRENSKYVVKPYFALIQRVFRQTSADPASPGSLTEITAKVGAKVRVAQVDVDGLVETSGAWFVSVGAEDSALFSEPSETADVVAPTLVHHGCIPTVELPFETAADNAGQSRKRPQETTDAPPARRQPQAEDGDAE